MDISNLYLHSLRGNLQSIQNRAEAQSLKVADVQRELDELQARIRSMQLVNQAFLEVIADRIGLDLKDVEAHLQELIQEDQVAKPCPQCNRPLPKSGKDCMYCGASALTQA